MKHYYDLDTPVRYAAIAFGGFDGMHIGHRAVIERLTDFPHPVLISLADNYNPVIYSEIEKEHIAERLGLEAMITLKASTYESSSVEEFVTEIVDKLEARTIVVGANYDRMAELRRVAAKKGLEIVEVPTVEHEGREVTSAYIRDLMANGRPEQYLPLLGDVYVMIGPVVHGKEAGRKHGMPTANLGMARNKIYPTHGVYGSIVRIGNSRWKGVTNVGLRPSDDDIPIPSCETFIIGFDGNIYDNIIVVEAYVYVRPVIKFPSLDEVRMQIDKDIRQIEDFIGTIMEKDG